MATDQQIIRVLKDGGCIRYADEKGEPRFSFYNCYSKDRKLVHRNISDKLMSRLKQQRKIKSAWHTTAYVWKSSKVLYGQLLTKEATYDDL